MAARPKTRNSHNIQHLSKQVRDLILYGLIAEKLKNKKEKRNSGDINRESETQKGSDRLKTAATFFVNSFNKNLINNFYHNKIVTHLYSSFLILYPVISKTPNPRYNESLLYLYSRGFSAAQILYPKKPRNPE